MEIRFFLKEGLAELLLLSPRFRIIITYSEFWDGRSVAENFRANVPISRFGSPEVGGTADAHLDRIRRFL